MDFLAAALLGVVQGFTEFLPVSSSAHLILVRMFFGWDAEAAFGVAFDVSCHVGTLIAVLIYFAADIRAMLVALPAAASATPGPDGRRLRLLVVGTVPIVIVGAFFAHWLESATRTPFIAATALLTGALVLLAVERLGSQKKREEQITAGDAFAIGVAQCFALIPGVSRSGSTIAMGMALGIERAAAARFTFLLSVPAIIAVAAKEGLELRHAALTSTDFELFAIGMVASAIVGYATVRFFIQYLGSHRLDVFSWYRIGLAVVTFAWLALR